MSRLVHSDSANIRAMQISKKKFFIYVEGGLDRSFYDQLLRSPDFKITDDYEIRAAKELEGGVGGKQSLIRYFRLLKRKNELSCRIPGMEYVSAFAFDKDVDDVLRKKLRSQHVIYTETYDLEGHLFQCGDFSHAVAMATGITHQQAKQIIGDQDDYYMRIVNAWTDWAALCILSQFYAVNVGCTFDRSSTINENCIGSVNEIARDDFLNLIAKKVPADLKEVTAKFNRYKKNIREATRSGLPFKFFKGKWMRYICHEHTAKLVNLPDAATDGLAGKVLSVLVSQVGRKENCACCSSLYVSLQSLTWAALK